MTSLNRLQVGQVEPASKEVNILSKRISGCFCTGHLSKSSTLCVFPCRTYRSCKFSFFFYSTHCISGTGFSNYDTMNLFVRMNNLGLFCACGRLMQCHVMKTSYIVYAMVDDSPHIGRCRAENMWRLVTLHLCVHWPLSELYLMYIMLILLSSSCD
jgi:hypothetical protein